MSDYQSRKKYFQEYRNKCKDQLNKEANEKIKCSVCGKEYSKSNKLNHEKTMYHNHAKEIKNLKSQIKNIFDI